MEARVNQVPESAAQQSADDYAISKTQTWARRLLFVALVLAVSITGAVTVWDILAANGFTYLESFFFVLFVASFTAVSIGFTQGLIGFVLVLLFKKPEEIVAPVVKVLRNRKRLTAKTALLFPVYNEDVSEVTARILSLVRGLEQPELFSVFILSDTRDVARGEEEKGHVAELKEALGTLCEVTYRRREQNTGKKAGNIWDFCERWGPNFEFMVVFDADSVMRGSLVSDLVRIMEASPRAGIVQTLPFIVNPQTVFARMLQLGHRLCGDIVSAGAAFWQLDAGNYYGHNAIIRVSAFRDHCKLPILSGNGPLSGEIMSHDFVEAAYIRRAGYEVWDIPTYEGSYEELPERL